MKQSEFTRSESLRFTPAQHVLSGWKALHKNDQRKQQQLFWNSKIGAKVYFVGKLAICLIVEESTL